MTLIDPQPMETFKDDTEDIFVECTSKTGSFKGQRQVLQLISNWVWTGFYNHDLEFHAWSYTATCKEKE